jgi:molybdenum cofactor synthesis domain-containing protein
MISVTEALTTIERESPILDVEVIPLEAALGRILAEPVVADRDIPPFHRSQMDGFAIRSIDCENIPVMLRTVGESLAGKRFDGRIESGTTVKIMTGAPVPAGADHVIPIEEVIECGDFISIPSFNPNSSNIVRRGEEIQSNTVVFREGQRINSHMIATLASFGYDEIAVRKSPRIAVISTGKELVAVNEAPSDDQIRDSNSPMLLALCKEFGYDAELLPRLDDDFDSIRNGLKTALESDFDLIVTTGGVSVGEHDHTKPAIRAAGAELFFEKLDLKPGKPTVFARCGDKLVFGLPGNPVSVGVTFHLFVRHALLKMQGATECGLRTGFAITRRMLKSAKGRDTFLPVSLATDLTGTLHIENVRFSGSSNFIAFASAEAVAVIPKGRDIEEGEAVEVRFLR